MILTSDFANILFSFLKEQALPVYQGQCIPVGEIEPQGRIVIHVKEQSNDKYWSKVFADINIYTPDTPEGYADLCRLNGLERSFANIFPLNGKYEGTCFRIELASVSILADKDLKAHFVHLRVLCKVINIIS